jgi:hypothetical protein
VIIELRIPHLQAEHYTAQCSRFLLVCTPVVPRQLDLSSMRNLLFRLIIPAFCLVAGCTNSRDAEPSVVSPSVAMEASSVPLRVWVVAPVSDVQIFLRQWQSNSDQPLDIRPISEEELWAESTIACDVLLYPARLVGELAKRGWIVKLPGGVKAVSELASEDVAVAPAPAAWRSQASYAGLTYAVPLGCSIPVFAASQSLADVLKTDEAPATWSEVFAALEIEPADGLKQPLDEKAMDRDALVDRYLAILATLSQRDPAYGLLFDMQSMQSRLKESDFVRGMQILASLSSQADGQVAISGSHSQAMTWATSKSTPALAITVPALIDSQAAAIKSGQIIRVSENYEVAMENRSGAEPANPTANTPARPTALAWNTGGGILASMPSSCRQSNQATAFLRWLADPTTRAGVGNLILGVESTSAGSGMESIGWKARQALAPVVASKSVAQEPRLPSASQYRRALADELIQFLSGRKTARQALADADRRWQEITDAAGPGQRLDYEQSLGLAL